MIAWTFLRSLTAPAGVLVADPDWLVDQYTGTTIPLREILNFPRAPDGSSVLAARSVRFTAQAVDASGAILAPTGTLSIQILEVVPGARVVEVVAALPLALGVDLDGGLTAFGQGDYLVRAFNLVGAPALTSTISLYYKVCT